MKAIIYAGIGLFSVATVYGVVDYYNSQKKGTLDKLYKEPEEVVVTERPLISTTATPINTTGTNPGNSISVSKAVKKSRHQKRTIRLDEFSRGRIEEPVVIVPETWTEPVKEEAKKPEVVPAPEARVEPVVQPAVVKKELRRKISLDQFSRAPLRIPVKTDTRTVEVVKKEN